MFVYMCSLINYNSTLNRERTQFLGKEIVPKIKLSLFEKQHLRSQIVEIKYDYEQGYYVQRLFCCVSIKNPSGWNSLTCVDLTSYIVDV